MFNSWLRLCIMDIWILHNLSRVRCCLHCYKYVRTSPINPTQPWSLPTPTEVVVPCPCPCSCYCLPPVHFLRSKLELTILWTVLMKWESTAGITTTTSTSVGAPWHTKIQLCRSSSVPTPKTTRRISATSSGRIINWGILYTITKEKRTGAKIHANGTSPASGLTDSWTVPNHPTLLSTGQTLLTYACRWIGFKQTTRLGTKQRTEKINYTLWMSLLYLKLHFE